MTEFWAIVIPLLWIGCIVCCAALAYERRYPQTMGVVVGLILGPVGVALLLLIPTPQIAALRRDAERYWLRFVRGAEERTLRERANGEATDERVQAAERAALLKSWSEREQRQAEERKAREAEKAWRREQREANRAARVAEKARIAEEKRILREKAKPKMIACPGCGGKHTLCPGERVVCSVCGTEVAWAWEGGEEVGGQPATQA